MSIDQVHPPGCDCIYCEPPVPAAPALPEGWVELPSGALRPGNVEAFRVSLDDLRALLASQGLRVIGPEESAVLEAMSKMHLEQYYGWDEVYEAELARRGKP